MSLLHDIQVACISENVDVCRILRMCKVLAVRLSYEPLETWTKYELDGYPDTQTVPNYRIFPTKSYGRFVGYDFRFIKQISRLEIPLTVLPERFRKYYEHAVFTRGISEYNTFTEVAKTNTLHCSWHPHIAMKYGAKHLYEMECLEAWQEIPVSFLVSLVDSVKKQNTRFCSSFRKTNPQCW